MTDQMMSDQPPRRRSPVEMRDRIAELERELCQKEAALERERLDSDMLREENRGLTDELVATRDELQRSRQQSHRLSSDVGGVLEQMSDYEDDSKHMGQIAAKAITQAKEATVRAQKAEKAAGIEVDEETRARDKLYVNDYGFEFPVSADARVLFNALPEQFDFDRAYSLIVEGQKRVLKALLQELLDEGCLRQRDERFEKTGHVPFF